MEKPIIFSTPMMQAILEGRKTMTRRIIKPPFEIHANGFITKPDKHGRFSPYRCPYGEPGDILWVRETWCNVNKPGITPEYCYRADCLQPWIEDYDPADWKWRSSMFMPRKAARIFLLVTNVRVERLQEITEEDAMAEGFMGEPSQIKGPDGEMQKIFTARENFSEYWDLLNAKRGYGWDTNSWVWVISFERTKAVGE